MNPLLYATVAAMIFAAGGWSGIEWHAGRDAIAAGKAQEAREADARQQIRAVDKAVTSHAKALATINRRLGDAREKIAQLTGRECFNSAVTGVLNAIGADDVPGDSGQPADSPAAAAAGADLRFTTDRDAAGAIALCRARYAEVASQLNQILDFEDARQHLP